MIVVHKASGIRARVVVITGNLITLAHPLLTGRYNIAEFEVVYAA